MDKPAGLPVHGGPADRPHDVVRRLTAWLRARNMSDYLGVHQRLDQDASGVLAFTRRTEANERMARGLADGTVRRTYVATIAGASVPDGLLEDRLATEGGRSRVVRRGGKLARARCRTLARDGDRSLVEILLETGRTHQIRVQLASRGAPIVGDALYGGTPSPRLLLHAVTLSLPGIDAPLAAEPPLELLALGRPAAALPAEEIAGRVADALAFRWALARDQHAFRWIDGAADGLEGVVADAFGTDVVVCAAPPVQAPVEAAIRALGGRVATSASLREGSWTVPVGVAAARARVDPRARGARALVARLAAGAAVLVVGAGRGAFTAVAAVTARESTTVDERRGALARAAEALALAGAPRDAHRLLRGDVATSLRRVARGVPRFDLAVFDGLPRVAAAERLRAGARSVRPGGAVVVLAEGEPDRLHALVVAALARAGRPVVSVRTLPRELDHRASLGPACALAVLA